MSFENPNPAEEEKGDDAIEGDDGHIYESMRRGVETILDKFDFVDEGDIVEVSPEKISEEVPVFVSPGWGVSPEAERSSLEAIAKEGERRVITADFTREDKLEEEEKGMPAAELQKALAIVEIINKKGLRRVDAVGHSEGGLNLAMAASLFPEKFRNLVFVSPAGSVDNSFPQLVKKFSLDEGVEELKGMNRDNLPNFYAYTKAVLKNFLKNPVLSGKEISAMTKLDIFKMTKRLKESGVGVTFVVGGKDKVFPMEEINNRAGNDNLDYYVTIAGNHGSFIFDQRCAQLSANLLDNMKRLKSE